MIVDSVVLVILLISALISLLRGLIREILTIAGVVGASVAAYFGGPALSPLMHGWIGADKPPAAVQNADEATGAAVQDDRLFGVLPYDVVADGLSYGLIFIVVVGVLSVLSHFIAEAAKSIGLGAIDRTLGFIFGIARGVLVLGLLYLPIHFFIDADSKASWFKDSKTHFYIEKTSEVLAGFIPQSAVEGAEGAAHTLSEAEKTRRTLQGNGIDLLKPQNSAAPSQEGMKSPEKNFPPANAGQGYDEHFRDTMDRLFEDESAQGTGQKP